MTRTGLIWLAAATIICMVALFAFPQPKALPSCFDNDAKVAAQPRAKCSPVF